MTDSLILMIQQLHGNNHDLFRPWCSHPGEQQETVDKLATFFEKDFKPVLFDNCPTWDEFYLIYLYSGKSNELRLIAIYCSVKFFTLQYGIPQK